MEKRLLLICSEFYPFSFPGAHGAAKMARYIQDHGWRPTVLCPGPPKEKRYGYDPTLEGPDPCEVVRVPRFYHPKWTIQAAVDRGPARFSPFVAPTLLFRRMWSRARELCRDGGFHVLLATSPMDFVLNLARKTGRRFGLPWVADMRDVLGECVENPGFKWRYWMSLERRILDTATAVVAVTEPIAEKLRRRQSVPVHTIMNGFDPNDFPPIEDRRSEWCDIIYSGSIQWGRDPTLLFDAMDGILADGSRDIGRLRVLFYGEPREKLAPFLEGRPCASMVEGLGRRPYGELVRAEQRAAALLLLTHPNVEGIVPSKIFEYFGAGRPILAVPSDGSVTEALIRKTHTGLAAASAGEIREQLLTWYDQWQREGQTTYEGVAEEIAPYTRQGGAAKMAALLDEVAGVGGN